MEEETQWLQVLYEALSEGWIASAEIDVTEPEPLPTDSPLWQLPNLMMTPHISGQFHLPETFERIVDIAAANLEAYLKGEKPQKSNSIILNCGDCQM